MNVARTLAFRLMLFLGGALSVSYLVAFLLLDAQVKRIVDRSQREVYAEKLEGVGRLLETRVRRLEATGMRETYEEDFKTSALKTLRDLYYRTPGDEGHLFVLDGQGKVLLHPGRPRGDASPIGAELHARAAAAAGEFDYRDEAATDRWMVFRPFPAWDWTLAFDVPWSVKYADLERLHRELLRVMAISTLALLALFFVIITYFTRPIVRLTRAASAMAAGDLDHDIEARDAGGTGEVGVLAESFIRLRDAIRGRIDELKTGNEELRREVAQRERAEAELGRRNVELQQLDRMKDELVRNVSHELKTPVAKQAMQLEILHALCAADAHRPQVAKVLAVMDASVSRQQQVIRDLLDLARLESGHRAPSRDLLRLDQVLAGIVEEFRALTDEAGLTVRLESEPVAIRGDREFLWHIFSNLVSNSLKYRSPEGGGRIDVAVSRRGETAVAVVSDNGRGMSPEEQQRAFDKFYQASASVEGSGVGLTIAREMTELLGGRITLRSAGRGLGTEVTVTFPAAASP